ncbi:DUF397 domain-containing protein [Streptomyces cocklensis]|uniref:DUF397 domain-containing protein n=1 Tax=Actinacidiphila cocklensis TaxID=887465 RepID=A0A9W4DT23_9ACTN|nr:DUF397 domain-containing protein [Actinacidiphila cocklensis]MDD1057990.1 DUF397 domain-containing protein [Actinacidiphila cocklensis]CAG6393006.1 conserved hypothetical protein [Actinacidiphila cocklensis]
MTHRSIPAGHWLKSSYSQGNGGDCVEWAPSHIPATGEVPVRDSKDPHGPSLSFSPTAWTSFLTAVKSGSLTA